MSVIFFEREKEVNTEFEFCEDEPIGGITENQSLS